MSGLSTILLVDDDEAARYLGQRLLKRLGVQAAVREAANGQEALYALQAKCLAAGPEPTLILLDINMPVMGGFEFLDAYNGLPLACRQAMHVVIVTSSVREQDVQQAESFNIELVTKPLSQETLTRLLHQSGYSAEA